MARVTFEFDTSNEDERREAEAAMYGAKAVRANVELERWLEKMSTAGGQQSDARRDVFAEVLERLRLLNRGGTPE